MAKLKCRDNSFMEPGMGMCIGVCHVTHIGCSVTGALSLKKILSIRSKTAFHGQMKFGIFLSIAMGSLHRKGYMSKT